MGETVLKSFNWLGLEPVFGAFEFYRECSFWKEFELYFMLELGVLKCQRIKLNQTGSNYFSIFVIDIIKDSMQWSNSSSKMLLP